MINEPVIYIKMMRVFCGTALLFLLTGCAGPGMPDARMPRYVPEHAGRVHTVSLRDTAIAVADTETQETDDPDTVVIVEDAAVPVDDSEEVLETAAAVERAEAADVDLSAESISDEAAEVAEAVVEPEPRAPFSVLRRGDRVNVFLRGIPTPEDISDVVDELGNIKIGLIGSVRVAGLTTAEAEKAIERAFIDGGFYRRIDAIIVAQSDEYFVRGEVQRPGRYPMSGDITLIQALSTAGGYTDYARPSRINIIRSGESLRFNATRIERQRDPDPRIQPGDIIIVNRRVFF